MNAAEFSGMLAAVKNRSKLPAADWKSLSSRFPYAPAIHVLRLLANREESPEWTELLHQTAARTLSRSRLQFLVEGEPELEAEWLSLPDKTIPQQEEQPAETAELEITAIAEEPVQSPEETETPEQTETQEKAEEPEKTNDFVFTFVRLKAGRKPKENPLPAEKLVSGSEDKKSRAKQHQQEAIIEKFLNEKPFLQPRLDFGEEGKVPDLASKSGKLKEEIVTESMAMIYIKQKKIPQAIATLRKLTLKIPEKSDYFAALIKNLESQNPS